MGIYRQPNRWQCGPFALKHALLVHGILVPEWEISRVAGTNQYGTDEVKLAKAARRYDCDLSTLRSGRRRMSSLLYTRGGAPGVAGRLADVERWEVSRTSRAGCGLFTVEIDGENTSRICEAVD